MWLQMRDEFGTLCEDTDCANLFPRRSHPAEATWRHALVTRMRYAEKKFSWLRELDAIETLRRAGLQYSHAHEQQIPWRMENYHPLHCLITSPHDVEARVRPQEKPHLERIRRAFHRDL